MTQAAAAALEHPAPSPRLRAPCAAREVIDALPGVSLTAGPAGGWTTVEHSQAVDGVQDPFARAPAEEAA